MLINNRVVAAAMKAATNTQGIKRYKLGAVLFKRNRIFATGGNRRKTHPALVRYSAFPYLHAESDCVLRHGVAESKNCNILVVRIDVLGKLTMAKPCDVCLSFLRASGIREVYYSSWDGSITSLSLDNSLER